MASERQLKLAALVAAGVPGPAAMLQAGWPVSTASWLGKNVDEYLRKAGLTGLPQSQAGEEAAVDLPDDKEAETAPQARQKRSRAPQATIGGSET